ncbi:ketopantoate reductase family protein [Novosphingobium sp.]|uniref:ketopantoate reductase family protein n=1 Tax=Novosphingobium sp. TaxID=1874826 RepID=UPI002612EE46|nr:ketopantoate reductase family protein [Novosphingobium sp.]
MRIAVIGAGAIGCTLAAALADAGRDVVLVARGRRLAQVQAGPVRIESGGRLQETAVKTLSVDALPGPVDFAICCVKTYSLEDAVSSLRPVLSPNAIILTLQNGVEAHRQAAQLLPGKTILAGRMHGFYEMVGDRVRHVGVAPSILLGCTQGDSASISHALAAFAGNGIAVDCSPDIVLALWEKFLLAASLGGVAAALGLPAGKVSRDRQGAALLRAALQEVAALAEHLGIGLTQNHIAATLAFVASFPPDASTSLQRDLAAGRASERDALTAAVCRIASAHGFKAEVFASLDALITARWL